MTTFVLILSLMTPVFAFEGHDIETNQVHMANAPKWLTRVRVDKVLDHIQPKLEWDIRKIEVFWYDDEAAFEARHKLGPNVMAVSMQADNSIHLGPKIKTENFDQVFGHELVHIISYQKYKGAIPKWLEEGLANHLSKARSVDYAWLAKRPFPEDVRNLTHPFKGSVEDLQYHYYASQALIEMIAKKCDLMQLIQMSVKANMNDYLDTYCEIKDLNGDFHKWIKAHAGS